MKNKWLKVIISTIVAISLGMLTRVLIDTLLIITSNFLLSNVVGLAAGLVVLYVFDLLLNKYVYKRSK